MAPLVGLHIRSVEVGKELTSQLTLIVIRFGEGTKKKFNFIPLQFLVTKQQKNLSRLGFPHN